MASNAERIEQIFVAHAKLIQVVDGEDAFTSILDYEPGEIDRKMMPMLTMFFLLPQGDEVETGPTEDIDYRWEISLYVSLASAWKEAQAQMRDLSQLVVANFRQHRGDYNLAPEGDLFARHLHRREPPTPDETDAYLRASWELKVTSGEE